MKRFLLLFCLLPFNFHLAAAIYDAPPAGESARLKAWSRLDTDPLALPGALKLSGQTNEFTDSGSQLLMNGSALGGDTVWTNDTAGGNAVLQNVDQSKNLALMNYNSGNLFLSTWGDYPTLDGGGGNTILGNAFPAGPTAHYIIAVGDSALGANTNAQYTIAIGYSAGANAITDFGSICIGNTAGPGTGGDVLNPSYQSVFVGWLATSIAAITNGIALGANAVVTNNNTAVIGHGITDFYFSGALRSPSGFAKGDFTGITGSGSFEAPGGPKASYQLEYGLD